MIAIIQLLFMSINTYDWVAIDHEDARFSIYMCLNWELDFTINVKFFWAQIRNAKSGAKQILEEGVMSFSSLLYAIADSACTNGQADILITNPEARAQKTTWEYTNEFHRFDFIIACCGICFCLMFVCAVQWCSMLFFFSILFHVFQCVNAFLFWNGFHVFQCLSMLLNALLRFSMFHNTFRCFSL